MRTRRPCHPADLLSEGLSLLDIALFAGHFKQCLANDDVVGDFFQRGTPDSFGLVWVSHAPVDRGNCGKQSDSLLGRQSKGLLFELRQGRGGLIRRCPRRDLRPNREQLWIVGNVGWCRVEQGECRRRPLLSQRQDRERRSGLNARRLCIHQLPQDLERRR